MPDKKQATDARTYAVGDKVIVGVQVDEQVDFDQTGLRFGTVKRAYKNGSVRVGFEGERGSYLFKQPVLNMDRLTYTLLTLEKVKTWALAALDAKLQEQNKVLVTCQPPLSDYTKYRCHMTIRHAQRSEWQDCTLFDAGYYTVYRRGWQYASYLYIAVKSLGATSYAVVDSLYPNACLVAVEDIEMAAVQHLAQYRY